MEDAWQPIASAPADVELELGGAMSVFPCGLSRPIGGFGIAGARNLGRSPRRFGLIDLDQGRAI
jgi:hypothetical protein